MSKKKKKRHKERRSNPSAARAEMRQSGTDSLGPETKPAPTGPSESSFEHLSGEIDRLISKGKSKEAVAKAKEINKTVASAESNALVGKAYLARVKGMYEHGLYIEAQSLAGVVAGQYPVLREQLEELRLISAIRRGTVEEVIAELLDAHTPPERRKALEDLMKCHILDPEVLVRCPALPSDHPMKKAASDIKKAFTAVTTGLVKDSEIDLPDISRRSPLSPWKMLIRAIACFYRKQNTACLKYLEAVDPESAPARLVPVVKTLMSGEPADKQSPAVASLLSKVQENPVRFEKSLRLLDEAFQSRNLDRIPKSVEYTVKFCQQDAPPLFGELRQHITIRLLMANLRIRQIEAATAGPCPKDHRFWHLYARAAEEAGDQLKACSLWEEFRRTAVHSGLFPPDSPQVAAIYLHMAALLRTMPSNRLRRERQDFSSLFKGYRNFYLDQPPYLQSAAPQKGEERSGLYFLFPEQLYERACKIKADPDIFRQWLDWVRDEHRDWKVYNAVALSWHNSLPRDSRPLLLLMQAAERRGAYKMALGYLERAESLDGLNPEVRRARLRLLVSMAIKHLRQRKPHLACREIEALTHLSQMNEGDRPAFLAALKWVYAIINGDSEDRTRHQERIASLMNSQAAAFLVLNGVGAACGLDGSELQVFNPLPDRPAAGSLAADIARSCALGMDMAITFWIPLDWEEPLIEYLTNRDVPLKDEQLLALCESALRVASYRVAYAASGCGLVKGNSPGRFLFMRAKALPSYTPYRREKCLTLAIQLARQQRDMELVKEAVDYLQISDLNRLSGSGLRPQGHTPGDSSALMAELEEVLRQEKEAENYPKVRADDFYSSADRNPADDCNCPVCRARRGEPWPGSYDDDFDSELDEDLLDDADTGTDDSDEADEDEDHQEVWIEEGEPSEDDVLEAFGFAGDLPPKLKRLLMEFVSKYGQAGEPLPGIWQLQNQDPDLMFRLLDALQEYERNGGNLSRLFGGPSPEKRQKLRKSRVKKRKKGRRR